MQALSTSPRLLNKRDPVLARFLVIDLTGQRYALPLAAVERVVPAVEVTRLPGAPALVLGVIDVAGHVVPLLSLRRRLGMLQGEVDPADQFVIAQAGRRAVALLVDAVEGVVEYDSAAVIDSQRIAPGLDQFQGVVQLDDGLVLIHDLEKFLSVQDARALDAALEQAA